MINPFPLERGFIGQKQGWEENFILNPLILMYADYEYM